MKAKKLISALLSAFVIAGSTLSNTLPNVSADYSRVSVHDPSIVKLEEGGYFIIGSHLGAARSNDLKNWQSAANSHLGSTRTTFFKNIYTDLAVPEKWSNTTNGYNLAGNMWAPDIIYNKDMGKYCMYLSVNGQVWNSSVVLCTADKVEGPYIYQGTIVYSGFTNNAVNNVRDTDVPKVLGKNPDISRYLSNGSWNASYGTNAIDPAVFYDEDGNLRMVYGSWFGGIYMLELDEKTGLRDYNVKYETIPNVSDAYMGKKAAGGNFVSGEGPYIEYMKAPNSDKGYYYLFVSYGFFNSNGGYNMRIFRSEKPDGPFVDQNGNSAIYPFGGDNIRGRTGERLMSNYQWRCNPKPFKAQGHNSALMDADGKLYVVYHTKFDDNWGAHEVRVHQLIMNEDGWITAAPYEYSGESLSEDGHSMLAVAGDYDFIFHSLDQKFENEKSADVEKPHTITLHEDGTITGHVTGTWLMKDGTPNMSLSIGGVTYKGAFLVQSDESVAQTKRMTFTATGNNTCVWGSKRSAYNAAEDVVKPVEIPDGRYTLRNVNSGYYIADKSGNIVQSEKQVWNIKCVGNGEYTITDKSGKALTVENESADNGANVVLSEYTGDRSQKFRLNDNHDGSYSFLTLASNCLRCLDVYEISTDDGANICQWEFWNGSGQQFILEEAKDVEGDVNADGSVTVADLVMMQSFLLSSSPLTDWQAGDLCKDDRIDVFDFCLLRRILI